MRRAAAVAVLLALAACHGSDHQGVTLDADEDARNATGAKIDADLAAADAAAKRPLPTTAGLPQASGDDKPPTSTDPAGPDSDSRSDDNDQG